MALVGFRSPDGVLLGGRDFSTKDTDINGNWAVTPPPSTTGVPMPAPTQIESLSCHGFLNADGAMAQNIVTDPNQVGIRTPGMTTYGPDSLSNPLQGGTYGGTDTGGLNAQGNARSNS